MTWQQLIIASKTHLARTPAANPGAITSIFSTGAEWMHHQLYELQPTTTPSFNPNTPYTTYGLLKYGICGTASIAALIALATFNPWLIPLSIIIFYLAEIHFLFLFPILIDQTPHPILASIRATYRIGITKCLLTVIPIATYMLIGLLHKKDRLTNWYIGCLAIIIWYNHEIRTRL
jgi:hypothetical protein